MGIPGTEAPFVTAPLTLDDVGLHDRVPTALLDGALSVQEGVLDVDERVPLHVHELDDQLLFVVSGRVRVEVGGRTAEVGQGSWVVKPRGVPHGIENVARTRSHVIELTTSDRFVRFRQEAADIRADADLDDPARDAAMAAVARRYGMRFGPGGA